MRRTTGEVRDLLAKAKLRRDTATSIHERNAWSDVVEGWEDALEQRGEQVDREPTEDDSLTDGHEMIVSYGDCELYGRCQCGKPLGSIRPDKSLDELGQKWERHVMLEVQR